MATNYRKERLDRGIKVRSDDICAVASYREVLYLLAPRVLPVVALLALPLVLGPAGASITIMCCVYGILAVSWDLFQMVGMISLGQALFFGLGAYVAGSLNYYFGLPPLMTIPVAAVGGGILSTLLLAPIVRLRGIYFGMVTLTLSLILARIIEATHILGGTEGLSGLTPLSNMWTEVYLLVAALLACLFGFRRLINTDYGVVMRAIGENDRSVLASGVDVYRRKIWALFIGSTAAAFTGAFMAHHSQIVGISAFALDYSILPIACAVVGGTGTFAGSIVGAFLLVPVSEFMRSFGMFRIVFYCLVMVVFIVGLPEGIFHYLQRRYHQFERLVEVETKT